MTKRKKLIVSIALPLVVLAAAWAVWSRFGATTRVALVEFQPFQAASIVKAGGGRFVRYDVVAADEFHRLGRYDFILGFGMGMRITAGQREQLRRAAEGGVPVFIHAATNPDNDIRNLDSLQYRAVEEYMSSGGKANFRNLARYIRRTVDGKCWFAPEAEPAAESASDVLFHLDENVRFDSVEEYERYLREQRLLTDGGAKVAIVGGLNDPFGGNRENIDSLIVSLQRAGMNVYPVASVGQRLRFLEEIAPDAVIYFPHGRLAMGRADAAVEWLKERNIPIFAPLTILGTRQEWEADAQGMFGGFMSQSVVMPELDGAIYPYVVNAQEVDGDGVYLFKAIPERLADFTKIVGNFVSLKRKPNAGKRVAIYFFKGAGQATLTAQGLETIPSLYNLLKRLRAEGYNVDGLPATEAEFGRMLMSQGAVLSTYAAGAFDDFLRNGNPALVPREEYESWVAQAMPAATYADVVQKYGPAPGEYMSVGDKLAVARIELGNVALLPQPMAAVGDDSFAIVHGAKSAPPHTYIGAYLWSRYAFGADAMLHFGTHGSLEFTPSKQVALSGGDWPEILVGTVPHFYYYTIGNVGESMMAKRRSYATTVSYLTPAFMESGTRGQFRALQERVQAFYKDETPASAAAVRKIAVEMGLHRELRLDSVAAWSAADVERVENFAEEIATEKMAGGLYTAGVPYTAEKIRTTVEAMSADPIAYSLAALDRLRGKVDKARIDNGVWFTAHYGASARAVVASVLGGRTVDDAYICSLAGITPADIAEAREIVTPPAERMMAAMTAAMTSGGGKTDASGGSDGSAGGHPAGVPKSGGGHPSWIPKFGSRPGSTKDGGGKPAAGHPAMPVAPVYSKEQRERAAAIVEIERTVRGVANYRTALQDSPEAEMRSVVNALAGGYVAPTSGGDAVANPRAVPTGRNLYSVNAETTPSETAWSKGVELAEATLAAYLKQHGEYPRKVSYTFWSSEFIETEGATIAQVLHMLGVEPVRDAFGRVSDLRLVPSEELGRPRVDVVVQTSGQLRDLAASRLALISRAVEMAAAAPPEGNYVHDGAVETERLMVEQGVPPAAARQMSTARVFGGINGMYGTGIQEMATAGDRWESESELADTYIHNMGAVYGSDKAWGEFREGLFRAVLGGTDVVVQPRQSNTWGALSLDHVFEFMGGLNLAVREVTGKDPDAYFADYRNRNRVKIQELKEAIGVESRSTLFNPAYIREVMKGGASSASRIAEFATNTYGWNVMKPDVIDNEMWDKFYEVYVKDSYGLGTDAFFRRENPQALQEVTAVMLETARKGMWSATDAQLADLAALHTDLAGEFGASGGGFAGSNTKLQDYIAGKVDAAKAARYRGELKKMQTAEATDATNGTVLRKERLAGGETAAESRLGGGVVAAVVAVALVVSMVVLRRKRRK